MMAPIHTYNSSEYLHICTVLDLDVLRSKACSIENVSPILLFQSRYPIHLLYY